MTGLSDKAFDRIKAELQKAGVSQNDFATAISEMKVETIRASFNSDKLYKKNYETLKQGEHAAVDYMVGHPDHRKALTPAAHSESPGTITEALLKPKPAPFAPSQDYKQAVEAVNQAHEASAYAKRQMGYGSTLREHLVGMMSDFLKHGGKDQQTHGHDTQGEKVTKRELQGFLQEASGEDLAKLMHSLPKTPGTGGKHR